MQRCAEEPCSLLSPGGGGAVAQGCADPTPALPSHCSFQLTVEMFDYMDCELKLSESGEPPQEERGARVRGLLPLPLD